jgi:hypothetical protein
MGIIELRRMHNISNVIFYNGISMYGGIEVLRSVRNGQLLEPVGYQIGVHFSQPTSQVSSSHRGY